MGFAQTGHSPAVIDIDRYGGNSPLADALNTLAGEHQGLLESLHQLERRLDPISTQMPGEPSVPMREGEIKPADTSSPVVLLIKDETELVRTASRVVNRILSTVEV